MEFNIIDFSKAFDSVCHSKPIRKLEIFGIGGKLLFLDKRLFGG